MFKNELQKKKLISYLISQLEIGNVDVIKKLNLHQAMGFIKTSLEEVK